MAETLKIENFGPIKKANLKLGKTTIFIGEQSSGKSTIAKLIAIFRDADFIVNLLVSDTSSFNTQLTQYNIFNYTDSKTTIYYHSKLYNAKFENGIFSFELNTSHKELAQIALEYKKSAQTPFKRTKPNTNGYKLSSEYTLDSKHYYSLLYISVLDATNLTVYIPAERILLSTLSDSLLSILKNDIPLPKFLLNFGSEIEKARQSISTLNIESLQVSYLRENNQDWVIDKAGKKLKITTASSGIQANVPLFIVIEDRIESSSGKNFIVEEPELNLYPATQLKLISTLSEKCTKDGNQLVITTHSPYVLTALNNLLFAYKTAAKKPEQKKKINKIIPEASWLNPDEFTAYYVGKGTVKSIHDKKTGLIGDNHLDDASYEVGDAFDGLMEIYKA